jgi:hypothetical protein
MGAAAVGPRVITHPSPANVSAGGVANFSVTAEGTIPLTYQWQLDQNNIGGATSSTYRRTTILADNGTQVRCVVSNAAQGFIA